MKITELNRWTPVLQHEETPKLCFEGYVCRSNGGKRRYTTCKTQSLVVRLGSYLFRGANGEIYSLVGELYDPGKSLPLSVKSKFKNGIPKNWQSVAKFWDSVQNHPFCRKQLRSFSSRFAWLESLKASGVLRVSSRGRIIIPSPKYLKGKKVEQREIDEAHFINTHLKLITTNMGLAPANINGDQEYTPRRFVENICDTLNKNNIHQYANCETDTGSLLCKNDSFHEISAHSRCCKMQTHENSVNNARRSSINQRKVLTCNRRLVVAEVQNKMYRCGKTSRNTYEKITKKKYCRCPPHRRKYLLRSTSATRLLQKNNECKKESGVSSNNKTGKSRSVISLKKQPLPNKKELSISNNKNDLLQYQGKEDKFSPSEQNCGGKVCKEIDLCKEIVIQKNSLGSEHCSEAFRNESAVNAEKSKGCGVLLNLPYVEKHLPARNIKSDSVLRNCANRIRRTKQCECCQERSVPSSSGLERSKRKSENSPPLRMKGTASKALQSTYDDSGTEFSDRNSSGFVASSVSAKRHEERNVECIPTEDQNSLQKMEDLGKTSGDISTRKRLIGRCVTLAADRRKDCQPLQKMEDLQKTSDDVSTRKRFSGRCEIPLADKRKDSQPKPKSNESQRENRKNGATCEVNGKTLHNVMDKSSFRKKCLSTNKCTAPVTSTMEIAIETQKDVREAATTVTNVSNKKVCKKDSKQPSTSDLHSSEKTVPPLPAGDILETLPKQSENTQSHISLGDIEDILTAGAPRTLKQRKKLRKTIDTYAKTQNTCTDLFSDPDYHHLIGDNDTCSSQEWDTDYAEAVEKLVNGKSSDQVSLGSTPPTQYLQDFISDDNQSVRSTSPFQRTPCDEDYKMRYVHRVLKEKNEHARRKSLNVDLLASFAHSETHASTEAEAAYTALIEGKPVPQKLFDLKCRKNKTSSDDSSSECSEDSKIE